MKWLMIVLSMAFLAGCAGTAKKGASRYDLYDAVRVEQMVGNNVDPQILSRTMLCLNGRRESRRVSAITNVSVVTVTNITVTPFTNQTVSLATNYVVSLMTNLAPAFPTILPATLPAGDPGTPAPEGGPLVLVTNPPPSVTTNVTVSLANNQSSTTAANQVAANQQAIRTFSSQITTTSNNLSIALMTNQVVTAETNQIVVYQTNIVLSSLTNTTISPTNLVASDYYLYTELIPPPEFSLQGGESLVLLVDGVRYGLSPSPSGTVFAPRRGFQSTLYRVPPELLLAIANAGEVKVRVKGANSVMERRMSRGSIKNFKVFLVKYFSPALPVIEPTRQEMNQKVEADRSPLESVSNTRLSRQSRSGS